MRGKFTRTGMMALALGAVSLVAAGCGAAVNGAAAAVPLMSSAQGVAMHGPLARPVRWTRTRWSPAGTYFAFAVDPTQGVAEVGSTNPLRVRQVVLGSGRSVVALTAHDAIVASWGRHRDWVYPLQGTSLGAPVPWTGPTDSWQQWVDTAQGPAIVTGGYRPGTLALAWANGHTLALAGSQVYIAPSGRVGAVVGGHRDPAVVHPVGNQYVPSLHQPSSATAPIRLWQFDAAPSRVLATLHLPVLQVPKAAGRVSVERIVFSPNGRYVAIWVMGDYGVGAQQQMVGATFIYAVASGHLMGQAPVGNGIQWAANSQFLWIGTPDPAGHGADRVVNLEGHTVWTWPDTMTQWVIGVVSGTTLLVMRHPLQNGPLAVWRQGQSPENLRGIHPALPDVAATVSPSGQAAIVDTGRAAAYATWSPAGP